MIINKFFKTDSRVFVIDKKAKVGGTSFINKLEELAKKESAVVVKLNFEDWAAEKTTVMYISGLVDGVSMAVKDGVEVVVLLGEVTYLSDEVSTVLIDSMAFWLENTNVSIICTGEESDILDMFKSLEDTKHFSLDKYSGGDFVLLDESGATVTIEGCIP